MLKFSSLIVMLCFSASMSSAQTQSVSLGLNWKAEPEFGGFYEALRAGYYKNEKLDVNIIEGGSGTPTIQMLANEKIDFAIVSADEIILSRDRKNKNNIVGLFSVYQISPYIIMSHAERNFKSLEELWRSPGTLSLQSGLPYYQFLEKKWGKPKAKVVPYLGGVSNFLNDKKFSQQGFISTEPASAEKAGAKVKNFLIADEGFDPYLVVVAVTEKTLKERPELVKKFIRATRFGWENYLKDPAATKKHMATLNKALDLESFHKGAEAQKSLIFPEGGMIGEMKAEKWSKLVNQLKELKVIKKAPPVETLFQNP